MSSTDWSAWHEEYADPDSLLSARLRTVQSHIDRWLDATAPAPVTVLSACAGDGRDLLEVLEHRADDAGRVTATLIEYDARIAERARAHARRVAADVRVRHADAGVTSSYADAVPADLVLLCGIFGNVSDADVRRTVASAPALCRPGATVIWTRHRKNPDLTPAIRAWFDAERFEEVDFVAPNHAVWSVGVARFTGEPRVLSPDERLFTFVR